MYSLKIVPVGINLVKNHMKKTRLQELFFKRQTEKDNTIQPSKRRSLNIDTVNLQSKGFEGTALIFPID